jgi:hypothetical protein
MGRNKTGTSRSRETEKNKEREKQRKHKRDWDGGGNKVKEADGYLETQVTTCRVVADGQLRPND